MLPIVDAVSHQVTTFGKLTDGLAGICCNSRKAQELLGDMATARGCGTLTRKVLAPPRRPLEEAKSRPSGPQVVAEIIPDGLFPISHF